MIVYFLLVVISQSTAVDLLFGYGSLVADYARDENAWPVRVHGLSRCWCYNAWHVDPPQTALAVHADKKDITTNGVIFPVEKKRLKDLDIREREYQRIKVNWADVDFIAKTPTDWSLRSRDLWVYALRRDKYEPPSSQSPIAESYVDICTAGFLTVGGEPFAKEFIETTYGWDTNYVLQNRGENTSAGSPPDAEMLKEIDRIFEKYQPSFMRWKREKRPGNNISPWFVVLIIIITLLTVLVLCWILLKVWRLYKMRVNLQNGNDWEKQAILEECNKASVSNVRDWEPKD